MEYKLQHHGILGQKWGVRRYQNADGTLTEAGKKHYYSTSNDHPTLNALNKEGRKFNSEQKEKANRYKNSTAYNVSRVDKNFETNKQKYLDANKKNNEHFLKERDKWLNQEGKYKNKDYYQFKDISLEDWLKTDYSKMETEAWNAMKKSVEKAAKEHPLYEKTFKQLSDYSYKDVSGMYEVQYGKYVVDQIMNDIRLEAIKNQK